MRARALDKGAVTLRGRVVDGKTQAVAWEQAHQWQHGAAKHAAGNRGSPAADAPQSVVGGPEGGGDAGGAEPRSDGSPAACEQSAAQQQEEVCAGAPVQSGSESGEPGRHDDGQVRESHGRLLAAGMDE